MSLQDGSSSGEQSSVAMDEALTIIFRTIISALVFTSLHLALRPVVRWTKIPPNLYVDWMNRVVSVVHSIVSATFGITMLLCEPPYAEITAEVASFRPVDTVHAASPRLWLALPFTLGYFLYDSGVMYLEPEVYMHLMVVHHAVSILVWPISLVHRAGTFYVAYFLFTEVSTPFLHLAVFFLPKHDLHGTVHTGCGWCLLLVFFLARVLPAPMLLYSLATSWPHWSDVDPMVRGIAMCTLPLPPFMFIYWYSRLIKGAIKHLTDPPGKAKKAE